jgi:group I intron endonuclease
MANGIYIIKNIITNKVYIGSSASKGGIKERLRHHKSALKHNKHSNSYLQKAYNKHGHEAFTYEILEECSPEKCLEREQHYLDLYKSYDPSNGYNLCPKAGNTLGRKHSRETRQKIGQNRKYGIPYNKGQKISRDLSRKLSKAQKNSTKTQAHLAILNKGKRKPVTGINLVTGETIELEYASADPRFTNGGINMCCRGKISHYKGFKWTYKQ